MSQFKTDITQKLVSYFQKRLDMKPAPRGWLSGDCPDCGAQNKFGIHLGQNRSNCFKCAYHEKPLDILIKIEKFTTYIQAYKYLGTFTDAEYLEIKLDFLESKSVELPESFRLISLGTSFVSKLAQKYMQNRGFKLLELSMRGVGYCTKGEYHTRIIIPYYQQGKLIYFNARQFMDVGPKFKNPKVEDFGIGKSMLIYNVDALAMFNRIYLVESATNSLTLGERAIAIGGKILSNYQKDLILRSGIKEVIIILDDDAYLYALQIGLDLVNYVRVKVILMPPKIDVNDLGRSKTIKWAKTHSFLSYSELLTLKIQYEMNPKLVIDSNLKRFKQPLDG